MGYACGHISTAISQFGGVSKTGELDRLSVETASSSNVITAEIQHSCIHSVLNAYNSLAFKKTLMFQTSCFAGGEVDKTRAPRF